MLESAAGVIGHGLYAVGLWVAWLVLKDDVLPAFNCDMRFRSWLSWFIGVAGVGAALTFSVADTKEVLDSGWVTQSVMFWPVVVALVIWVIDFTDGFLIGIPIDADGRPAVSAARMEKEIRKLSPEVGQFFKNDISVWDGKTRARHVPRFWQTVENAVVVLLIRQSWLYGFESAWPLAGKIVFWLCVAAVTIAVHGKVDEWFKGWGGYDWVFNRFHPQPLNQDAIYGTGHEASVRETYEAGL